MARPTMDVYNEALGEIARGNLDAHLVLEQVHDVMRNRANDVADRVAGELAFSIIDGYFTAMNDLP